MNETQNHLPSREAVFFGKIGADVSHQMRNTLSIIGEYAGLAEDLLAVDENGKCRDPVRARELVASIGKKVRAGAETMERLSRVAHSADAQTTSFDLAALAEDMTALSRRRATLSGCRLEVQLPDGTASVTANLLNLQCAILSAIELMLQYQEKDTSATIQVAVEGPGAKVVISGKASRGDNLADRIAELSPTMDVLRGTANASWEAGILLLTLTLPIH